MGLMLRRIRQRRAWRQVDLAVRAGVSRQAVSRIERGALHNMPVGTVQLVANALDARIDLVVRWHGGDLGRLINARHAAMHEAMARMFAGLPPWIAEPEVSYSIWGERGVVDLLCWHPPSRALLVVELKSELVDLNELLGTLDRKRRLASEVARSRGWHAATTSAWVVVAESQANRRAALAHGTVLRSKLPTDGRGIRAWLRAPNKAIAALSFLSSAHGVGVGRNLAPVQRVNRRKPRLARSQRCDKQGCLGG